MLLNVYLKFYQLVNLVTIYITLDNFYNY